MRLWGGLVSSRWASATCSFWAGVCGLMGVWVFVWEDINGEEGGVREPRSIETGEGRSKIVSCVASFVFVL